jgi:hypothetical protein
VALTTEKKKKKKKEKRKQNSDHHPTLIRGYLIKLTPSPGPPSVHLPYTRLVHFTASPSLLVNPPYSFGKIITFPFTGSPSPKSPFDPEKKNKYINDQLSDIAGFFYKKNIL